VQQHGELRADDHLDPAINMLAGTYYTQYLEDRPFSDDRALRLVDTALDGIA
jgi:hypothetical protein